MEVKVMDPHTAEKRAKKEPSSSCEKTAEGVVEGLQIRMTPRKHKAPATNSCGKIRSLRIRKEKIRVKIGLQKTIAIALPKGRSDTAFKNITKSKAPMKPRKMRRGVSLKGRLVRRCGLGRNRMM